MPRCSLLIVLSTALLASACALDPIDSLGDFFPQIPYEQQAQACVRGKVVPPVTITGTIATTDCHVAPGEGYVDGFRVRVDSEASVRFAVESTFDSELELFRIDDLARYVASAVSLADDDNGGEGVDALLVVDLVPDTEYLLRVSGKDDLSRGTYTLRVTIG